LCFLTFLVFPLAYQLFLESKGELNEIESWAEAKSTQPIEILGKQPAMKVDESGGKGSAPPKPRKAETERQFIPSHATTNPPLDIRLPPKEIPVRSESPTDWTRFSAASPVESRPIYPSNPSRESANPRHDLPGPGPAQDALPPSNLFNPSIFGPGGTERHFVPPADRSATPVQFPARTTTPSGGPVVELPPKRVVELQFGNGSVRPLEGINSTRAVSLADTPTIERPSIISKTEAVGADRQFRPPPGPVPVQRSVQPVKLVEPIPPGGQVSLGLGPERQFHVGPRPPPAATINQKPSEHHLESGAFPSPPPEKPRLAPGVAVSPEDAISRAQQLGVALYGRQPYAMNNPIVGLHTQQFLCPECSFTAASHQEVVMHFFETHETGQEAWTQYVGGWAGHGPGRKAVCLICNYQAKIPTDVLKHAYVKHRDRLIDFIEQTAKKRGPISDRLQGWLGQERRNLVVEQSSPVAPASKEELLRQFDHPNLPVIPSAEGWDE
jgi:hypothetical protein